MLHAFRKQNRPRAARPSARVEPLEDRRLLSAGDLDPTFDGDGKATIGYVGSTEDFTRAIAVLPDNGFVTGGNSFTGITSGTLARYLADGSPDPGFGPAGSGKVRVEVPWRHGVEDIVANSDGSIIAIGTVPTEAGLGDVPRVQRFTPSGAIDPTWIAPRAAANITGIPRELLRAGNGRTVFVTSTMAVRLNADGTLDTTFAGGGKATYNTSTAMDRFAAYAGVVQPDGAVVLAGEWYNLNTNNKTAALRRYTANGPIDTSFGAGGTLLLPGVANTSSLRGIDRRENGDLVVVGYNQADSMVARVRPGGTMDGSFAAGLGADNPAPGIRIVRVTEDAPDKLYEVLLDPEGRVLAGGVNEASLADGGGIFVLRLTADGEDDWTFDGNGFIENIAPDPWLLASTPRLALQNLDPSGTAPQILIASGGFPSQIDEPDQTVSRFHPDGSPDASFGADGSGMVATDFRGPLSVYDGKPALQADGKVVFVGATRIIAGDLSLARLNADGTPDTAFGPADGFDDAVSENEFGARTEWASQVIVLPDGKLYVAGGFDAYDFTTGAWDFDYLVARFNPDGTPDETFGDGGKTVSDFGGDLIQRFFHAAAQPDGKLLAAGVHQARGGSRLPSIVRYGEDGLPDPSFGDGGLVLLDLPGHTDETVTGVAAGEDGKVVVTGYLVSPVPGSPAFNGDRFVVRLDDDGSLDPSFGRAGDGVVILDNGSREEGSVGLATGPGGSLFVAGSAPGTSPAGKSITVTKLTPDGLVDAGFGTVGTATVPLPVDRDTISGVSVTPQGQVLLSGARTRRVTGGGNDSDFLLIRLDPAGQADAAFGPGGMRAYDVGSTSDAATAAFPTADGKIVVAGRGAAPVTGGFATVWAVIRVEGESVVPPPASVAGRHVFYNNSSFDGNQAAAGPADDAAIASDKRALLPGQTASFANVSSHSRGINGIMVDVQGLVAGLTAEDFEIVLGAPGAAWSAAPAPASVTRRPGAGAAGSDRITLTWPDGSIRNAWLRVTVKANDRTGLAVPDVFYFGSLPGETGDASSPGRVAALDLAGVKRVLNTAATSTSAFDFNRDGRINALDVAAVRANLNRSLAVAGVLAEDAEDDGEDKTGSSSLLQTMDLR